MKGVHKEGFSVLPNFAIIAFHTPHVAVHDH